MAKEYYDIEKISSKTGTECMEKIISRMLDSGDNCRYVIRVRWQTDDGHAFIAEKTGNSIQFVDPQSNDLNVKWYFDHIKPSETCIFRVDNLKFDANVKKCCR